MTIIMLYRLFRPLTAARLLPVSRFTNNKLNKDDQQAYEGIIETFKRIEKEQENRTRNNKVLVLMVSIATLSGMAYLFNRLLKPGPVAVREMVSVPFWEMRSIAGNTIGSQTLKGSFYLMTFGCPSCPSWCLHFINRLSCSLKNALLRVDTKGLKIQQLFVNIDINSTPQQIINYQKVIGMEWVPLLAQTQTGLLSCLKSFNIEVEAETDEKGNTGLTHTSMSVLVSNQGTILAVFGHQDSSQDMERAIVESSLQHSRDRAQSKRAK